MLLVKRGRIERNNFLKPGGAKSMVTETELGIALALLHADFQWLDGANQQGRIKEINVAVDALRANLGVQSDVNFFGQSGGIGGLPKINAGHAGKFLKKKVVSVYASH